MQHARQAWTTAESVASTEYQAISKIALALIEMPTKHADYGTS